MMIRLQEYPNFRDLGGIEAGTFGRLQQGRVFRSEAVLDPGEQDAAQLAAKAIRLVFDLRSSGECGRAPNRYWTGQGAECLNLDLLGSLDASGNPWLVMREDATASGADAAMHAVYRGLPQAALGHAGIFLRRVADGGGPVLVHCTAGKDRTGFMIAMLLAALGAGHDAILEDYLLSASRKTAAARDATRAMIASHLGQEISEDALDGLMTVRPSYLAASFSVIDAQFGGIDSYLAQLGCDAERRAALQNLLLE